LVAVELLGSWSALAQAPKSPGRRGQTVVVEVDRDGFHWLDAGIGAAVAVAAMLAARGLMLARSPR
jgi:hypothetical protein